MADEDEVISANNNDEVFEYMGGDMVVPDDVVRARVHPSVTVIPDRAFEDCEILEVIDLCEGLIEIGYSAFYGCESLRHISIPSTVTVLPHCVFKGCERLEKVELCEGLIEIRNYAFYNCESLRHVNIPSTVKTIGDWSFAHDSSLESLSLPDGIEGMGGYTFCNGRFTTLRIPPLITTIPEKLLCNCNTMFSLELGESNIAQIGGHVFYNCRSLRNVTLPPNAIVDNNTFKRCKDLLQLFDAGTQIINALKHRFDNLPIHKMVYYHSYNNLTSEQLERVVGMRYGQSRTLCSKLDPTGSQQDCLGMTPLHILACSTVHHLELYQVLIEKYPDNLITEDRWGAVPLLYAVWGNASSETVQFLVESYKSIHPNYEFNWTGMITTLGERSAPESSIKSILDLQKVSFPAQKIDWDKVLNTLANAPVNSYDGDDEPLESILQFLLKVSISTRVVAIGIKLWRDDMASMMAEPIPRKQSKGDWLGDANSKLSHYEDEYQRLKEATTTLELVLWKVKLDESSLNSNEEEIQCNNKRKAEDSDRRSLCRISCGADIVIELVLPYLVPAVQAPACQSDEDSIEDSVDNDSSSAEESGDSDSEGDY